MTVAQVRGEDGKLRSVEHKKNGQGKDKRQLDLFQETAIAVQRVGPSMSKSALLLECQWWVNRELPKDTTSFEARYGLAFHEAMAVKLKLPPKDVTLREIVNKWNEDESEKIDYVPFKKHVKQTLAYLIEWLKGDNPWKVNFVKRSQARTEQSFAWNVFERKGRATTGPTTKDHKYVGASADELPGTADLVIDKITTKKDAPDLIVLDYKTGANCDLPKHSPQLRSLLMTAAKRMGYKRVAGGILHSPREGAPFFYVDEFSKEEFHTHADALRNAWSGIGRGMLRPGPWCYKEGAPCPAFSVCPAHTSAIGQLEVVQRGAITPEKIGRAHEIIQRFEAWSKQYKETVIRPWVVKNGPAPRPDGKLVTLRKKEVRNLSMSSIERKLGKVAGQKKIEELDREGLIERQEREELVAVSDK